MFFMGLETFIKGQNVITGPPRFIISQIILQEKSLCIYNLWYYNHIKINKYFRDIINTPNGYEFLL